jgi:hypothetical protein
MQLSKKKQHEVRGVHITILCLLPRDIENSKSIDPLLLSVLIFCNKPVDNCIVLCLSFFIFFNKFIRLKINVAIILNKSLAKDFYAMFLTFIKFPMIMVSLIL